MPLTGAVSDVVGRPLMLMTTVGSFIAGTILCAVSHGIGLMIAGRCLQGIGGGGVIILSLIILSDMVPMDVRPKYLGVL